MIQEQLNLLKLCANRAAELRTSPPEVTKCDSGNPGVCCVLPEHRVKPVEAKYVCFIAKQHFDKPQTTVVVEGKSYYGCCPSSTQTPTKDPKSGVDVDPVSGRDVDKATAVIDVDKAEKVYFFESVENLKKFRVPASP